MKPGKDHKRMWYTGGAFYVGYPIDYVPVREPEKQRYTTKRIECWHGSYWHEEFAEHFHETKEEALAHFHVNRKKRITKLKREIASLEKAEPKWREK